jgi:hypothetical protein
MKIRYLDFWIMQKKGIVRVTSPFVECSNPALGTIMVIWNQLATLSSVALFSFPKELNAI